MAEATQDHLTSGGWEIAHQYGDRVHVLNNVHLLTLLARLSTSEVQHPEIPALVRTVYRSLLIHVAGIEFPRVTAEVPTRMAEQHPDAGVYRGPILDPATHVVIVDVVRAGIVPSQTCFEMLCSVLPGDNVRIDHMHMSRITDAQGHVAGVDLSGSKIGGSVEDAILLLPDPMGATGSTTCRVVDHYIEHFGCPRRVIAMPMISTPEYLRRVLDHMNDLSVYTARLDRGLSDEDVLEKAPGEDWEREQGLNENGYIVPGAGGLGEVINNSWC